MGALEGKSCRLFAEGTRAMHYGINPEQIQVKVQSYYLACLLGFQHHVLLQALPWIEVPGEQRAQVQEELHAGHWRVGIVMSLRCLLPSLPEVSLNSLRTAS